MKTKNIFTLSALALALTLTGCGGGGDDGKSPEGADGDLPNTPDTESPVDKKDLAVLTSSVMEKVTNDAEVRRPDVAIADDGQALAVWAEEINGVLQLVAVEGDANENTWGDKIIVSDGFAVHAPNEAWLYTQITMDRLGNAVVGWVQVTAKGSKPHLKTVTYSPQTGFDTPVDHGESDAFILAGSDAGGVIVAWEHAPSQSNRDIMAAVLPVGEKAWNDSYNLTAGGATEQTVLPFSLFNAKMAINESGEATLLYKGMGPAVSGNPSKLQAAHLEQDGSWAGPETLVDGADMANVGRFAATIDKDGNRFTGWVQKQEQGAAVLGVVTGRDMQQGTQLEVMKTDDPIYRLAANYRANGSLIVAAEGNMEQTLYPLITVEVHEGKVEAEVYGAGGRYLTMDGDGDRVVALGRNGCTEGVGVRESVSSFEAMSDPICSTGKARSDMALSVTPDRAGVFAGVGFVRDETTFPVSRHDVIELTFFR